MKYITLYKWNWFLVLTITVAANFRIWKWENQVNDGFMHIMCVLLNRVNYSVDCCLRLLHFVASILRCDLQLLLLLRRRSRIPASQARRALASIRLLDPPKHRRRAWPAHCPNGFATSCSDIVSLLFVSLFIATWCTWKQRRNQKFILGCF